VAFHFETQVRSIRTLMLTADFELTDKRTQFLIGRSEVPITSHWIQCLSVRRLFIPGAVFACSSRRLLRLNRCLPRGNRPLFHHPARLLKNLALASIAILFAAWSHSLLADAIPYPNMGTAAPQVSTYAASSGGVSVYYYGSTAAFTDFLRVYDVNTGFNSGDVLQSNLTRPGTHLTVGTGPGQINSGDQLIFYIDSPDGLFASVASDSSDGINHGYITSYSGGLIGGVNVPAGIFVGLEDERGGGDLSYNDHTFVLTGISAPSTLVNPGPVPEPNSLWLIGTGAFSAAGMIRRKIVGQ